MLESWKEKIDKGVDYAFMTSEKVAKAARDFAKEHDLTKEEAKKAMDYFIKKSDETRKNLEANVQELVRVALEKLNAPVRADMKKLEERIKKLESGKKSPVRAKVATGKKSVQGKKKSK
jgi:polyhydroxyalkanoate synthesis regulator phasin